MSKLADLINTVLPIPKIKLADLVVFLSKWTELSSCYNVFNWLIPPVN